MLLFILALLLAVAFFYDIKHKFIYALVIFFVLFDMVDGFYKDDKIYAAIRYFVPLSMILVYVFRFKPFKKSDSVFLMLVVYLLLLWIYNAGDIIISSRYLLGLITALLMIPVGRYIGERYDFISEFEPYNRFLLICIPVYVVLANKFNIGQSYTEAFTTGFLITSRMYIVPIVVFLAIHYAVSNKDKSILLKLNDLAFILLNVCILLINTRRTALGMLAGAIIIYALLNRQLLFKMVLFLFLVTAALIFSYPLYEDRLTTQLERRERIQNIETYEEEGRYLETLYIIQYHQSKDNIPEFLFGVKLFDTHEFGRKYFGTDRPIHSDLNMLFYSTGVVGLLLFFIFFVHYFLLGNTAISDKNKKLYYPLLVMFLIILLPGRFIGTTTFAPFLMLLLATLKHGEDAEEEQEEEPLKQEADKNTPEFERKTMISS
ncbi:O-antigen ligase family protein [Pontibacter qinzhouensis]|uniref:O-antigen ligase family protein n=1 Tax=Pontibacter qinzhouensis TaxID=2603253 RepID=A0A5C8KBC1_9BACT|nr:O-antigen ligase family protein [Pontibacter qinzhouensis]TXK46764.1 O-antigen ligase family protein [Pontibacter qinzhouensis]